MEGSGRERQRKGGGLDKRRCGRRRGERDGEGMDAGNARKSGGHWWHARAHTHSPTIPSRRTPSLSLPPPGAPLSPLRLPTTQLVSPLPLRKSLPLKGMGAWLAREVDA
eukprot:scaffold296889_cov26-Tisochrysis_lutea.AAC.5